MDCPHSGKFFDNGFVLSVAIRIGVLECSTTLDSLLSVIVSSCTSTLAEAVPYALTLSSHFS
jgi:hypothetical protein